jgi:trimethylamine--corrinoid protein Co-methyltransferase
VHVLLRVHEASLEILESVGMLVRNEKAQGILAWHGCIVDKDTQIVQFPRKAVEGLRASIPPKFTFRGREACSAAGDRAV